MYICLQSQKDKRQKCGKENVRKMTENCVELMDDNNPKNHADQQISREINLHLDTP